jgi:nitrate reductase delta subunit
VALLGAARNDAAHLAALERIRQWTRSRFSLGDDAVIMTAQVACSLPGCPPLETVVVFWSGGQRHQFKLFKTPAEVVESDLPYAWLMPSLQAEEGGFDCC